MKTKLAVSWRPGTVSLFLFTKSESLKYRVFCLNEPADGLAANIKDFLGEVLPSQTILVIPRSEVLQKEMAISAADEKKEGLETMLSQLLPYSPKEMAFSLAIDSSDESVSQRGLLYAIPELKVRQIIESLTGLVVEEVVSEDQVLFWFFQEKASAGPIVVFDETPERILFLALKGKTILFSREYPRDEDLKNVLSETSFSILEAGVKPVRAFIAMSVQRERIAQTFEIPLETISLETLDGHSIPLVLSGVKRWGAYPVISLLPSEQKLHKRLKQQKKLMQEVLVSFALFIISFSFMCVGHLFFLKNKKAAIEKETAKLASSVLHIKQITSSLSALDEAQRSKERILRILGDLAAGVPSSVRLKELEIGGKEIVFQGEGFSHEHLTETVQVFEKMKGVHEAKLEHARLRKRLNQDYFDFEVTAQWKS